jgi:hypothetical protein
MAPASYLSATATWVGLAPGQQAATPPFWLDYSRGEWLSALRIFHVVHLETAPLTQQVLASQEGMFLFAYSNSGIARS